MSVGNKHPHYHKDVRHLETIDVYRVLALFNVTDPCIQHAVKKLLVAGGRGAGKDISRDIQEACDSLNRWQEMRQEDGVGHIPITAEMVNKLRDETSAPMLTCKRALTEAQGDISKAKELIRVGAVK